MFQAKSRTMLWVALFAMVILNGYCNGKRGRDKMDRRAADFHGGGERDI